ncbi:DUF1027 domain-containing protein [Streptococcus sp. KCJ4932]|uniref:YutD family protein n=1 Tax=Streptococcus sp. KCJ4932 TaxID=2545465 RepID=UPI0010543CDF|nr:YutD-like domain-containing protein [Streptococcus sp. KCJ4932]TDE67880.1 DUF1027 domain-containing protein [Streptococcus sp. KCJ4932]
MRKDISPEMYNYNKFPGPQFVALSDRVKSDDIELLILANEKDAFNATVFSQRFSEILLKYDYIVGDWGNEQLRLKGFYKDDRDVKKANRISRLDDYLKEYCNFGCAYFVLENKEPRAVKSEEEKQTRRHKSQKRSSGKKKADRSGNQHFTSQKRKESKGRSERHQKREQQKEIQSAKQFVIRRKEK